MTAPTTSSLTKDATDHAAQVRASNAALLQFPAGVGSGADGCAGSDG